VARVSTAESAARLLDGEEYLDLEQLSVGVCRAQSTPTPMGRVLPRSAIHQDTWVKILSQVTMPFPAELDTEESAPSARLGPKP
jgi:hypothetical protein